MNRMKRLLCLGLICYFCCLSMIVYGNEKKYNSFEYVFFKY